MTIGLIDILKLAGFDPTLPTKLVRHQDRRYPVPELRRHNLLELYQSYQGKAKFHGARQIVSFYGLSGRRAGFYGVYKVLGWRAASEGRTDASCDWSGQWHSEAQFFYDLERVGSAYGEGGIWARWRNYAKSGDGGNAKLQELIKGDSAYPEGFRFSVLQILPRTMARDEVLLRETLYKHKLGTRATGLNAN